MRITIHRGTHEIGGNCIEIQSGSSRIILDVGMPLFDDNRQQYDTSALRKKTSIELAEVGILPQIPGVFVEGPQPNAVLLSHAHEDHTGLIRHLQSGIPIYAGKGTSKMMNAGSFFANQPNLPRKRPEELKPLVPTTIGEFQVTPFNVDHSIYGAMAFLIEAGGKTVLYSGDLRLHGRKPGMTKTLLESLRGRTIDVLLMEGTHINQAHQRGPTEYELEEEIVKHVKNAPSLVLALFSPQHVDRLVTFIRTAKRTGRIFAVDGYTAYVLYLVSPDINVPRPGEDNGIRVFFPSYQHRQRERLDKKVFSVIAKNPLKLDEIRANPSKYLMVFRPSMLVSDFGSELPSQSLCLHSRWCGYLDREDWQPVKQSLDRAGGSLVDAHTSGHIFAQDIVTLVNEIAPKLIVPIHTFEPQNFQNHFSNVRKLNDGESFDVE